MKNDELQHLYAFENYATFDCIRKLKWNNNAMRYAVEYSRVALGIETTVDLIWAGVKNVSAQTVLALLFGALRAADPTMDIPLFGAIYKSDFLGEYLAAVIEGMKNYLPDIDEGADHGQNLDESWPDTQGELKKNKLSPTPTGRNGIGQRIRAAACRLMNLANHH